MVHNEIVFISKLFQISNLCVCWWCLQNLETRVLQWTAVRAIGNTGFNDTWTHNGRWRVAIYTFRMIEDLYPSWKPKLIVRPRDLWPFEGIVVWLSIADQVATDCHLYILGEIWWHSTAVLCGKLCLIGQQGCCFIILANSTDWHQSVQ